MTLRSPLRCALLIGAALVLLFPSRARAAVSEDVMCDPSHQDCRAMLLTYIQNERISIDLAMWFMEDQDLANAIIARKNAGVSVRILVDPRRNAETPMNAVIFGSSNWTTDSNRVQYEHNYFTPKAWFFAGSRTTSSASGTT